MANAKPETAASFEANLVNGCLLSFGLYWDGCCKTSHTCLCGGECWHPARTALKDVYRFSFVLFRVMPGFKKTWNPF